ncbi:MAG: amino acid adenylation domain-containing protein [Flammeovirgaceae bacterium]
MRNLTTPIRALLIEAEKQGMSLFVENGKLQFKVKKGHRPDNSFLAELKKHKAELMAFLMSIQPSEESSAPIQVIAEKPERVPLSSAQERLWFLHQLEGSINYHIPFVWQIERHLASELLETSFRELVNRHEILRTVYGEVDGQAFQQILPKDQWEMQQTERSEELTSFIQNEIYRPFDLATEHMLRVHLITISKEKNVLVMVLHHIAFDGWSAPNLLKELTQVYEALKIGKGVELPALPIQYSDYALWQLAQLKTPVLADKLTYWEQQLQGISPLNLPTIPQHKQLGEARGNLLVVTLNQQIAMQLGQFAQAQQVTPFIALLSVFKVLLFKYTAQSDISVGSPVANRTQAELSQLVGLFVNTLVFRTEVDAKKSFTAFLQQVKQTVLDGYEHQEVPFEKIVERLVKERDRKQSPLFQVMFTLDAAAEDESLQVGESTWTDFPFESQTAKFDLTFNAIQKQEGLELAIEYRSDLFSEATIQGMARHFEQLLTAVIDQPESTIEKLELLSAEEKTFLVEGLNQTQLDYTESEHFLELFEQQVKTNPTAIAVRFDEEQFTYAQVYDQAAEFAHHLVQEGVQPNDLVSICMDRHPNMLTAMLAVMMAGAAYVPIDPDYPADRIAFMLADSNTKFVLSEQKYQGLFSNDTGSKVYWLDAFPFSQKKLQRPAVQIDGKQLAYIIYTSGSTGKPKGVAIQHSNLTAFIRWCRQEFAASPYAITYAATSICFDLSIFEFFYTLTTGKQIRILANALDIPQWMEKEEGILLNTVPSVINNLLEEKVNWEGVTVVNMAGEPIPLTVIQQLELDRLEVRNLYGPSEDTTYSTYYRITEAVPALIGRPIGNTQVYLLDQAGQLVPQGVIGELCLGGKGLAAGYLNREQLTQERFIPNPFAKNADEKLYKTGDLARWTPDGELEYLGRRDDQVKIRGYRIELGEVENSLIQQDAVAQGVVVVKKSPEGSAQIVAYVVPEPAYDANKVLAAMKQQLPHYMIPSALIELEEIPRTPNGKVDKKALPEPDYHTNQPSYLAPRNETEKILVTIWESLLQVKEIGVEQDFFALGGHSLLVSRFIAAIRKQLNIEVPMKALFDFPTIAQFAQYIAEAGFAPAPQVTIQAQERPEYLPLSFAQESLWLIDKQLEDSTQYHTPLVLRLQGKLDEEALENALKSIVTRHEVLRTVIRDTENQPFQLVLSASDWTLTKGKTLSDKEIQTYIQAQLNLPFQLSSDYMMRAELLKVSDEEQVLFILFHHIACDGWSIPLVAQELQNAYQALSQGQTLQELPLPIQYADYAIWQRETLVGEYVEQKVAYWEDRLSGSEPLELSTDFPRPAIQSSRGNTLQWQVNKALADQLENLAKQEGATLFMTLLSSIHVLLYKYTGQTDTCIGTPVANRFASELDHLIGFFVNTLALRSELDAAQSFRQFLKQVKTQTIEDFSNQEVPFERLVARLVRERDLSRNPLFQVMFVLQHVDEEVSHFQMGDVTARLEGVSHETSKFDLSFSIAQQANGFELNIEYATDLFAQGTIERLGEHLIQLWELVSTQPTVSINQLNILSEKETDQLLHVFNDTAKAKAPYATVLDWFAHAVTQYPNAIALYDGVGQMNYEELHQRSNQVAQYLHTSGVQAGDRVGLCMEHSMDVVIALLGILKVGAAYVPIDPNFPAKRVAYIVDDAAVAVIITKESQKELVASHTSSRLIVLDDPTCVEEWTQASNQKLHVEVAPAHAVYVIYTSGTTGKPKGVVIEHQNLLNYVDYAVDAYREGLSHFNFPLFTTLAFDLTQTSIYLPLLTGGSITIEHGDIDLVLNRIVANTRINSIKLTPSHVKLLDGIDGRALWKCIIVGGEALAHTHVRSLFKLSPQGNVFNEYGPTEATIGCVVDKITAKTQEQKITIGKPIANTAIYILDTDHQPVPIGVKGELYIAGAGLARHYLNKPELTAERFVEVSLGASVTQRMYKTGDIARWLPTGTIDYLGRVDDQVKINGYRIELNEISHALQEIAEIEQSAIIVQQLQHDTQQLVAYYVASQEITQESIQQHLRQSLPSYMLPSVYMPLAQMPLTKNGKIDKKALPLPEQLITAERKHAVARNQTEEDLMMVWKQLLLRGEREEMGIHDNFFAIGGDSIIAIQVVNRLRQLGYQLRPRVIFEYQTIADLAANILQETNEVQYEQGQLSGEALMLPMQHHFFSWSSDLLTHYNQQIIIKIDKSFSQPQLETAFAALVKQHDALRFQYKKVAGEWKQYYGSQVAALITVDLTKEPAFADEISRICTDYQQQMNPIAGELVKAVWFKTPETESHHRLSIAVHHLAIDGVSWRILLDDLARALRMIQTDQTVQLGAKGCSVREWAAKLQAQAPVVEKELPFWKEVTAQYQALPTKSPEQQVTRKEVAEHTVKLSKALTTQLTTSVHTAYQTEINDLLLTALLITLQKWTNRTTMVIGLEGHGRDEQLTDLDVSNTVGWFTNSYPVALSSAKEDTLGDAIKRVKEQLRAVPNKGMGYGVLRYLHNDANVRQELDRPSWDILFNYLGNFDQALQQDHQFAFAEEDGGKMIGDDVPFLHKLELNSLISEGELILSWSFPSTIFDKDELSQVANSYLAELTAIIQLCEAQTEINYTPSDFKLASKVSIEELDVFLKTKENQVTRQALISAIYPLSPLQEGMLFHCLYEKDLNTYLEQFVCELQGPLHYQHFEDAWAHIIQSHSALRTAVVHRAFKMPMQYVYKKVALPLQKLDWTQYSAQEQQEKFTALIEEDKQQEFDFTVAPFLRLILIKCSEQVHKLIWTTHHLCIDGWSTINIIDELLTHYETLHAGAALTVKEDNYQDFIEFIQQRDLSDEKASWKNYFSEFNGATLLPFVKRNKQREQFKGKSAHLDVYLEENVTDILQSLAKAHQLTINTLVQGAWAIVLSKYTGSAYPIFGVAVSGRPTEVADVENRVGLYINTLPIYTQIKGDNDIIDWLQELQNSQMQMRIYQHTSLVDIQQWIDYKGELFDSIISFQSIVAQKPENKEWMFSMEEVEMSGQSNFPLAINVAIREQLACRFTYNQEALKLETVERISKHFKNVLLQLASGTQFKVADIDILTQEEVDLFLSLHKQTREYENKTVMDWFEEQVARHPQSIAVVDGDITLSYAELDEQSSRLAAYLQEQGMVAEELVGICMYRSAKMIMGLIAILKAGGVYIPIDPEYPPERIRYMVQDAAIQRVLTSKYDNYKQQHPEPLAPVEEGVQYVLLDSHWEDIMNTSASYRREMIGVDSMAYVIYTSGSTGNPKGVMVCHDSLNNLLNWHQEYYQVTNHTRATLLAGVGFDASVWEIWPYLCAGAALHVVNGDVRMAPEKLLNWFNQRQITHSFLPTALVPEFVQVSKKRDVSLQYLLTGGDKLPLIDTTELSYDIVNNYGPTENTVVATSYILPKQALQEAPPIGKPINNCQIYLLDEHHKLVPYGAVGEIYISGMSLAKGYLNQPLLTHKYFIPNHIDGHGKLYKTGDLARWKPDGSLEYIQRKDNQIQIRGYRVELGEIESVLLSMPEVDQCVIIAEKKPTNHTLLVAYFVGQHTIEKEVLRDFLYERVPEYMIPTVFIQLDEMPLNANGKINRKALPKPESFALSSSAYVAPQNKTEKRLVALWEAYLLINPIGIGYNFFELGGHSLLAIRLVAAIEQAFEIELTISEFFNHPTIQKLAEYIRENQGAAIQVDTSSITREAHLPLSFSQERLWFLDRLEGSQHYHIPLVLNLKGSFNALAFQEAMHELINRHEILRTVYLQNQEGQAYQKILAADAWEMTYTTQEAIEATQNIQSFTASMVEESFDLTTDYMVRAALIQLADAEYRFILVIHHIAFDAWSLPIFVSELQTLYHAKLTKDKYPLPALPLHYADYAIWQRSYFSEEVMQEKLDYWKTKLAGVKPLNFPTDFSRPKVSSAAGHTIHQTVEPSLQKRLRNWSRRKGVTLYTTMLSAFKVLLYKYTGQKDICVGSPVANRGYKEFNELLGFFVNTLAFRSQLDPSDSFETLLDQVNETLISAFQHQDTPFEKVVDEVVEERDRGRNPLFQVMFLLQDSSEVDELSFGGTLVSQEPIVGTTSKFDFTCSVTLSTDELILSIEYCTDLFKENTIAKLLEHYQLLLEQIVSHAELPIGQLNMLSVQEEKWLLEELNGNRLNYSKAKNVIDLISEQVAAQPGATAVRFDEAHISYEELNYEANQLANYLIQQGVGSGDFVGICMDRSPIMLASLLAVLKSGATYVPIDPNYPTERIHFILEDAQVRVLISESAYQELVAARTNAAQLVLIDQQPHKNQSPIFAPSTISPAQIAYIIYTSGSTGKPKGVMITHQNMLAFITWCQHEFAETAYQVTYAGTSICFDLSIFELFYTLSVGKTVRILRSVLETPLWLQQDTHILLNTVPSVIQNLQNQDVDFSQVVAINMAGEPIPSTVIQQLDLGQMEVRNLYGPSEDTTYSTYYKFSQQEKVLIGKPIANTQVYLVDESNRLVPFGAIGELCLSGDGLAAGYLNREELTQQKFIENPFQPGTRLYKTGDLARWLSDGNLDYLGRKDDQVKIRGYRIELGEVEHALEQDKYLKECVVVAKQHENQGKQLVAYIVTTPEYTQEAMDHYLSNKLPSYMIPALFVTLEQLPRTPNGKIDKKALPDPNFNELTKENYEAPRNETEETLADIWHKLLAIEKVGIWDDFFQIGGHSLLVTQLVAMIERELDVHISLQDVFEQPCIAQLSTLIAAVRVDDQEESEDAYLEITL